MDKKFFVKVLQLSNLLLFFSIASFCQELPNKKDTFLCKENIRVNCISIQNNTIWIGSENGLYRILNDSVVKIYTPIKQILSIFIDKNNNKWIGTYKSVVLKLDSLNKLTIFDFSKYKVNQNFLITDIKVDSNKLWVATNSCGLINISLIDSSEKHYSFSESINKLWFSPNISAQVFCIKKLSTF